DLYVVATSRLHVPGYAPGIGDDCAAARDASPKQTSHDRPGLHIVVDVPNCGDRRWSRPHSKDVHLETIGVYEVRIQFEKSGTQLAHIGQNPGSRREKPRDKSTQPLIRRVR